jgi:hypothetical protein
MNFILHIFTYFGICYILLGMLHKATYSDIFLTCILNWQVLTFFSCVQVFWLNTLLIVASTLTKDFFWNEGEIPKHPLYKAE